MAYEKQTWTTGEVITQEKLNHMEDGIENAYELPAVTETDNGKVLGVENGQFGLVNGGSGGQVMVVPFMREYDGQENTYSTQVTYADIESMYARYIGGTPCMVSITNPTEAQQSTTFVNAIIYSDSQSPADPTPSYTLECAGMFSLNPDNVMYIRQDVTFRGDGVVSVFEEGRRISVSQ